MFLSSSLNFRDKKPRANLFLTNESNPRYSDVYPFIRVSLILDGVLEGNNRVPRFWDPLGFVYR